jgi:hypothetical protein
MLRNSYYFAAAEFAVVMNLQRIGLRIEFDLLRREAESEIVRQGPAARTAPSVPPI